MGLAEPVFGSAVDPVRGEEVVGLVLGAVDRCCLEDGWGGWFGGC